MGAVLGGHGGVQDVATVLVASTRIIVGAMLIIVGIIATAIISIATATGERICNNPRWALNYVGSYNYTRRAS